MQYIIPAPSSIKEKKGFFTLHNPLTLSADKQLETVIPAVRELFENVVLCDDEALMEISLSNKLGAEEYLLEIEQDEIEIKAGGISGAFYALQSLRQLLMTGDGKRLPCLEIKDSPRYSYRGLHLDESRHFFGKQAVKRLLDFMALYKLNRFHWHLTDDHGWRIEIEKYPLLTAKGAYRKGSQLHHWGCTEMDDKVVDGFYTKADIREIVAYAKARCIEIVPEIDFPAHNAAAIACYKDLACRSTDSEVFNFFGGKIPRQRGMKDWNRPICLGNDKVMEFVFDVLQEVCELFPYEYFHIGGDEAPVEEWEKCPLCQQRIKDEGLKNERALQGSFTDKLTAFLRQKGKTAIGWNEVLAGDITDRSIVAQYWTPQKDKRVAVHLEKGGRAILSCHKHFYFDMNHSYCRVKGTYGFTPRRAGIKEESEKNVLGLEAELWTEFIPDEEQLYFKLWHRGLALSENCWTRQDNKSYGNFVTRLQKHKGIADVLGYHYGDDRYTLNSSILTKLCPARKAGLPLESFDTEYLLSKKKG